MILRLSYLFIIKKIQKTFFLISLVAGLMPIAGCENTQKDIDTWTKDVVLTEEAINIESMLSQNGELRATLKAPLMRRVFEDTVFAEFPNSLYCAFYNNNKQVESTLTSKYGKYYENLGKVYLRDSVVVITVKGDTLKSPDLWWDQNLKKFFTDKYATYHAPGKQLYGTVGLEATQDLSSIIFKKPVGTILVNDSGMPQ